MMHISNVTRPDRYLNEAASFVNTTGSMSFNMTSPELLNLTQYQQTLRKLIHILASVKTTNPQHHHQQQQQSDGLKKVFVGTGGAFVLDTSVIDDHLQLSSSSPSSSQAYPLSFVASGPVPQLRENTENNHLYFLRLPLNPLTHPIQCQLSARRLCSRQVTFLDRILRRLCAASPGTFMMGYSDGLSGMDPGTEVVYSGENGPTTTTASASSTTVLPTTKVVEPGKGGKTSLDKSIAHARDHGDQELDHRVAEFVGGHVDHLAIAEALPPPLVSAVAKEIKARSNVLLTESVTAASQTAGLDMDEDQEPLNYDFGQVDEIDQLLNVASTVDIDELHDILWT
ncbi:hypothetical protein BG005_009973 [Podila minutissima]|nr:hypothetical protein BG005_009973 [Podila minutissima]